MQIEVLSSEAAIAVAVVDQIVAIAEKKPNLVLGVATGSSPLAVYQELGRRVEAGTLTLAAASAFALDEYVGLPPDHPESYRQVIEREFVSRVDIDSARVQAPNPHRPELSLEEACADYDRAIAAAGGVDYQILGIGSDGHIAFNEPGGPLDSRTHVGELTLQTRKDNARFFEGELAAVPTRCLTQGLGTIMEARQIGLIALGEGKARAVRNMIHGTVDPSCPASVLQRHPNATVYLDPAAASLLD